MFIIYLVSNDGEGLFGTSELDEGDLCWQPSESWWMIPGSFSY
jgi:hypothetical protein